MLLQRFVCRLKQKFKYLQICRLKHKLKYLPNVINSAANGAYNLDMCTAITVDDDCHLRWGSKYNVIVFPILNANKIKLSCRKYSLSLLNREKYTMTDLEKVVNFLDYPLENRNITVASMFSCWNNLNRSRTYDLGLFKFKKLWKIHYFTLTYKHKQIWLCLKCNIQLYHLNFF